MKKRVLSIAVLGLLFLAGCAFAKVREFKYFTLDIPKGWKIAQKGESVRVRKADNSASVIITIDDHNGRSAEDIAEAESKKLKGTKPEKDGDEDYSFMANDGKTLVMISTAGDKFIMLNMTYTDEKSSEELGAILDSFEMKDLSGSKGKDDDDDDSSEGA